jgi:hypothetical protein
MSDDALLATLRPWRLALVGLCDSIDNSGWPYRDAWWHQSQASFVEDAADHVAQLLKDAAPDGRDHLALAAFAILSALAVRASGGR